MMNQENEGLEPIAPFETAKEELVRIDEIVIGERLRKKFINIGELAESIATYGLQNSIVINEKKELISGGRRIEAYKMLGETFIPARIKNIGKTLATEVEENNQRESFTISEKIAIAETIEETIGERRGKPSKNKKNQSVTIPVREPEYQIPDGMETREFIAQKAGLGSSATLRKAKEIIENAIPEVVEAVDHGLLSVNFAYKISVAPKKRQLSMLDEAVKEDVAGEGDELAKKIKLRRKVSRDRKANKPLEKKKNQIFSLVRVAPDWYNEVLSDVQETPVHDFLNPDCGVVAIECPNKFVADAIRLIDLWGLQFKSIITVYCKNGSEDVNLDYINKPAMHLVIGQIDPDAQPACDWVSPVLDRPDLADGLVETADNIWPGDMFRLDMSSIEPRKGWMLWKVDYADGNDSGEELQEVDE